MLVTITPESLSGGQGPPHPSSVKAVTGRPENDNRLTVVISVFVGIALVCALATIVIPDPTFKSGTERTVVDGVTIFAVFFVAATAIERFLEPLSTWLLPTDNKKENATQATNDAREKVRTASSDPGSSEAADEATEAMTKAAKSQADLELRKWTRAVVFWAVATSLGMIVSASFKLYFLGTVGIAHAARWQEILATGLIIGAGTKPLHDLTELISAKKEAAQGA